MPAAALFTRVLVSTAKPGDRYLLPPFQRCSAARQQSRMPSLLRSGPTHEISYLDIRLDDPGVLIFRGAPHEAGGALIKGTLALCVKEKIQIKSITLMLQGIKRLHWTERAPPPVSGLMAANSKTVKHEEIVYEKKWTFLDGGEKAHLFTVKPNNYEYDFSETLSGDLPESIEGLGNTHIVYRLKARITRHRLVHDVTVKKHLRIVRTLAPDALELAQTMSVENLWPNKVEYSISIPSKAIVFGTSIPIKVVLVPLLKGLAIGKVICALKETHTLTCKTNSKTDTRHILSQSFEGGEMEEGGQDEELGTWRLQDQVLLPKSLHACVQDCEVAGIKIKHKLKFTIQLHNPDGHMSELRASLPVMLFISPNYLMDDNNRIPSSREYQEGTQEELNAPPMYQEHYFDQLYDSISPFQTPMPSGPNTPMVLSRSNSTEDLAGVAVSMPTSPLRIPEASSRRWHSRSTGNTPATTPGINSPGTEGGGGGGGDYFSQVAPSSNASRSGPSTRAPSPEVPSEVPNMESLSRVPSYSTAVRIGPRNLAIDDVPHYEPGAFGSAPASAEHSPATSPPNTPHTRPKLPGRSSTGGMLHRHGRSHDIGHRSTRESMDAGHRPNGSHHHGALQSLSGLLEGTILGR